MLITRSPELPAACRDGSSISAATGCGSGEVFLSGAGGLSVRTIRCRCSSGAGRGAAAGSGEPGARWPTRNGVGAAEPGVAIGCGRSRSLEGRTGGRSASAWGGIATRLPDPTVRPSCGATAPLSAGGAVAAITCVGESVREELYEGSGGPRHRISIVPGGSTRVRPKKGSLDGGADWQPQSTSAMQPIVLDHLILIRWTPSHRAGSRPPPWRPTAPPNNAQRPQG